MSLPSKTVMSLTVSCCTGLEKLCDTNTSGWSPIRQEAENMVKDAKRALQKEFRDASDAHDDHIALYMKRVTRAQSNLEKAEARLKNVADGDDKVVPNPFVVISVDGDSDDSVPPMLYTKVIRETRAPIWKEKFDRFPLGMYLTGRIAHETYHNEEPDYRPRNICFTIYHDDAIPDQHNSPKVTDDSWKRTRPQKDIAIGVATWDFSDICRFVGCPEFEKDLSVFNPKTNKKIKGATLTIKAKLSAPSRNRH